MTSSHSTPNRLSLLFHLLLLLVSSSLAAPRPHDASPESIAAVAAVVNGQFKDFSLPNSNVAMPTGVTLAYRKGKLLSGSLNFHIVQVGTPADRAFQASMQKVLMDVPDITPFFSVFAQYQTLAGSQLDGVASVTNSNWNVGPMTLSTQNMISYIQMDMVGGGMQFTPSDVVVFMLGSDMGFVQNGTYNGRPGKATACLDFCALHLAAPNGSNPPIPFIIMPSYSHWPCNDLCLSSSTNGNLTALQASIFWLSHEIADAITNPYGDLVGPKHGFIVPQPGEYGDSEIADLCQAYAYQTSVGQTSYILTKLWSNADNKCLP
ncbi:hypothetical protein SeLEV6574_g04345 [Synchytrium endobioticum]|uniref:Uncharacterized protein n=1 Tax=Synchytrium endobioticum TaxID=286115 RepID=A0A507CZW2_9FUNG|nr:hypothetical protein SeLEV6574_g04345 [Synchytrium endobioticum]